MRRFLFALVVLVGCDPVVDRHTPDGHAGDASPDALTHGMVSVKVYDPNNTGAVVTGVPVVFIEADGTVVGHPTTGTDGIAAMDVHKNASATAVITTQGSTQMQTITGLVPGDTIVLGPSMPINSTTDGTFTVSFPAYSGATTYRVYGPCGSGNSTSSPQVLTMYSDCKLDTMDLQVIAYDASNNPLVYLDKPNVSYTAGGTTAVSGQYQGLSTFTGTYTNIDPSITSINLNRAVPDGYGFSRGGGGSPSNGTLSVVVIGPQGTDAMIDSRVIMGRLTNEVEQKIAGNALTYGLDVGATILPWLDQPTFDVPTRKLTTPVTTTGTTTDKPDLFYADVEYSRMVGTTTTNFAWIVFAEAPADVTLPELPAEIGDVMPKAGDTINGTFSAMFEADTLTSWDAVRADVYTAANGILDSSHTPATRIRLSTYGGGT